MKKTIGYTLIIVSIFSCNSEINTDDKAQGKHENITSSKLLPEWVLTSDVFNSTIIKGNYAVDNRITPLYLEADFNGDNNVDVALPIIRNNKTGFAIIHGKTEEVFIIGAGTTIKNGLSDDMDYIDTWNVNRKQKNDPGIGEEEPLLLSNPSIQIEKEEVGGGQIYWDGKEYVYFHQSC